MYELIWDGKPEKNKRDTDAILKKIYICNNRFAALRIN